MNSYVLCSVALSFLVTLLVAFYQPTDTRLKLVAIFILVATLTYLFLGTCSKNKSERKSTLGTCNANTCSENNKLLDPKYNLRECAKQMILLEDHLNNPDKRCEQCIMKHMLNIEGLAEEGISLAKTENPVCSEDCNSVAEQIRKCEQKFAEGNDPHSVAEEIREIRKPLMVKYFQL